MKTKMILLAAFIVGIIACNANANNDHKKVELKSEMDSISYLIGRSIGMNLKKDKLEEVNLEAFESGIKTSFGTSTDTLIRDEDSQKIMQAFFAKKEAELAKEREAAAAGNIEKGKKFLEENKKRPTVKETASGLQYEVIREGNGASPKATDEVKVHYHGTLIDGTVFDSSKDRGVPAEFPLNRVIAGWTEGLQLMKVGAIYKFYIPSNLAYGPRSQSSIPGNSTLIFEVELLDIKK